MARSDVGRERITVYRYFEGIDFTDLADTISRYGSTRSRAITVYGARIMFRAKPRLRRLSRGQLNAANKRAAFLRGPGCGMVGPGQRSAHER